jgi:hypothetical protein
MDAPVAEGFFAGLLGKSARLAAKLAAVALVLLVLWTLLAYYWSYSSGERVGFVQKLSDKGWVCKTWEGELAMVNLPGQMSERFEFTVRDDAVAAQVNALLGQRVALSYDEHRGLPSSCFGETAYFVTAVRLAEPAPAAP